MCQEVEKEAVRFAQHLHSDGARVLRVPASISVLEALLGAHALANHEVRTHDRNFFSFCNRATSCQDRLGTNEQHYRSSRWDLLAAGARRERRTTACCPRLISTRQTTSWLGIASVSTSWCGKTPFLEQFHIQTECFTRTGSGQT